jgi:integrase
MPIYERGDTFMVSVGSGKGRYRASYETREDAELAELTEKQRRRTAGATERPSEPTKRVTTPEPTGKTLKDAYQLTVRLKWKGAKAEITACRNGVAVIDFLGRDTLLSDITPDRITELVFEFEDMGNSGSTINRKMSAFSLIMKTARDQGWITAIPKIPRRREGAHRIRWLDEAEEGNILKKCETLGLMDLRDFIIVAVDTGFRRGELMGFRSKDFGKGLLHLHAGETKTDEARAVPATSRVREVLERRAHMERPFGLFTSHTIRWQWGKLKDLLGLADDAQFVVHMLRHTCASRLVQRGVPLAVVQKWMGHKNIVTTLRYAHLAPENLNQAMRALEGAVEYNKSVAEGGSEKALEDADF